MRLRATKQKTVYFLHARDIRRVWGLDSNRYDHLLRMGIQPEEEVEGSGRLHVFDFKNVVQFGLVHYASQLGVPRRAVTRMLLYLDDHAELLDIYDSENPIRLLLHYMPSDGSWHLSGPTAAEANVRMPRAALDEAVGYITLNVGMIKKIAIQRLSS